MFQYGENNLIGYLDRHKKESYSGSDHLRQYAENLKKFPVDWRYKDVKIAYHRNDFGHRSVEVDELDNDFILFTGCSHTEGIGLPVEDSYPSIVAKLLKTNYYNLALGGSGGDIVYHNLVTWFKNKLPMPKFVCIQWPEAFRYAAIVTEDKFKNGMVGPADSRSTGFSAKTQRFRHIKVLDIVHKNSAFKKLESFGVWGMTKAQADHRFGEYIKDFRTIRRKTVELLTQHKVKFIEFSVDLPALTIKLMFGITIDDIPFNVIDKARDAMHAGPQTNAIFARDLIRKIEI